MDVRISDKATGAELGHLGRDDFQFLVDHLEEESSQDTDYYIDARTVGLIEHAGGSVELVALLKKAVGSSDGVDITWADA